MRDTVQLYITCEGVLEALPGAVVPISSLLAALSAWPRQLLQTHVAAGGSDVLGQRLQALLDLGLGLLCDQALILPERFRIVQLQLVWLCGMPSVSLTSARVATNTSVSTGARASMP